MNHMRLAGAAALAALPALTPLPLQAHGFAGDRFFPATLLTDDPFVADEMSAPTLTLDPRAVDGSQTFGLDFDLSKRLTPDIGITLSQGWQHLKVPGMPGVTGFTGFSTELDWQFFTSRRTRRALSSGSIPVGRIPGEYRRWVPTISPRCRRSSTSARDLATCRRA
jgi:hypothetical protein